MRLPVLSVGLRARRIVYVGRSGIRTAMRDSALRNEHLKVKYSNADNRTGRFEPVRRSVDFTHAPRAVR